MRTQYPTESWVHEGLCLRTSTIHGKGVFTTTPIAPGSIVIVWGGVVFNAEQLAAGLAQPHTYVGIGPDKYLANPSERPPTTDDFMNHSCDSTVWMVDEITLATRKPLLAGDELTGDYALWLNEEQYVMKTECKCGEPSCRKTITGKDWRLSGVQRRYFGHFSPFINDLISQDNG